MEPSQAPGLLGRRLRVCAVKTCRSNKSVPGVDGQDFADVVERRLGELALALSERTYRQDPIRRVFIPKAAGKLRSLGISTLVQCLRNI